LGITKKTFAAGFRPSSAMMALLPSIDQWSKGPVNQLVQDQF